MTGLDGGDQGNVAEPAYGAEGRASDGDQGSESVGAGGTASAVLG